MRTRTFCKITLAAAVAAAIPACGQDAASVSSDLGSLTSLVSLGGKKISIEAAAVDELSDRLTGRLYLQGDDGYVSAKRAWNGMFDNKKPAVVVRCLITQDVVNAVNFVRDRNLLVSVNGGGHCLPGK